MPRLWESLLYCGTLWTFKIVIWTIPNFAYSWYFSLFSSGFVFECWGLRFFVLFLFGWLVWGLLLFVFWSSLADTIRKYFFLCCIKYYHNICYGSTACSSSLKNDLSFCMQNKHQMALFCNTATFLSIVLKISAYAFSSEF